MDEQKPIPLTYASQESAGRSTGFPWFSAFCLAGCLVLMFLILWPSGRRDNIRPSAVCGTNLHAIGRACAFYSMESREQLPPDLQFLVTPVGPGVYQPLVEAEQLICPVSKQPYFYLTGLSPRGRPTDVIAYEPLWYHQGKGGNVLLRDGSVRWLSPERYKAVLAGIEFYRSVPSTRPW
ncbi:MAG: hypothetical protein AMXMBFR13_35880 [Phycisphaerae bacterium]